MDKILSKKLLIVFLLLLVTLLCVGLVSFNAMAAAEQFELNKINAETQLIESRIANLEVQIRTASNVNNIESRALSLGFVYPSYNQIVRLSQNSEQIFDIAAALRENAYR